MILGLIVEDEPSGLSMCYQERQCISICASVHLRIHAHLCMCIGIILDVGL